MIMKTIAFLTTLLMLTMGSMAQSAMDKMFDKYSETGWIYHCLHFEIYVRHVPE